MADISMCTNTSCPLFKECFRAQAKPSTWQSYTRFEHKDGKCEDFINKHKIER